MSEDEEIIILTPDDADEAFLEEKTPVPKWPIFLAGGVLLGAVIAAGLAWHFRPEPYDPSPLRAEIETVRAELETLKAKPDPVIPVFDLGPTNRRIAALENQPVQAPIDEALVERLEALQQDGFEIPEWPDTSELTDRVTALEAQVLALETAPPIIVTSATTEDSEPFVDPETLPRFPEQVLRDGVVEMTGTGFARRLISRHVRVRGSNAPDQVIDAIIADLEAGQPRAALAKFDTLPPQLASLARAWRANMDDALEAQTP